MKIQMKTVESDYNEDTGISTVKLSTDIGIFEGYAKLHPEDKDIASRFAGCRYAEMRAGIKYMKAKARETKQVLDSLTKIYKNLKQMNSFDKNFKGVKLFEKEIYLLEDEVETFKNNAKTLKERLDKAINTRPDIIKEIHNRNQDK